MKGIAILLLVIGVLLVGFLGLLYFFGFIMSFDAPGSADDLKAWGFRMLMFLPILALLAAVIVSMRAFSLGRYGRSVLIGVIYCAAATTLVIAAYAHSAKTVKTYRAEVAQDEADAKKYRKELYLRQSGDVTDTIIVFSSRTVAFRLNSHPGFPVNGPLGDLNSTRDTIIYHHNPHTKVTVEELREFYDEYGRRVIDVYEVR